MDASGTIDDSQWKRTKDFVRGVSSAFNVADNGTRTAVSSMVGRDINFLWDNVSCKCCPDILLVA